MTSRNSSSNTLERVKDILFAPIPLFGKPSARLKGRRAAVRRQESAATRTTANTFHVTGPLERGQHTKYAIGGEDFIIDENTWIFGEFRLGAIATIRGERVGAQSFARKVSVA